MIGFTTKTPSSKDSSRTLRHCVFAVNLFASIGFTYFLQAQPLKSKTRIEFFRLGSRTIPVQITEYGEQNGIVCLNLHDDEFTSVNAAMSVLRETGGTLIKIQNKKERMIEFRLKNRKYIFDPNRMFSRRGIESSLEKKTYPNRDAIDAVEEFAKQILALIPDSTQCLVALHNNTPGHYSIKSYLPGGNFRNDAKKISRNAKQDEDDMILTTDSLIYEEMARSGYNSILQDNEKAAKDGSLSVYYGELGKSYINIETEHGHREQYREMLQALLEFLDTERNYPRL